MGDETGREGAGAQRLDKWLWYSRISKSRTLAAQLVLDGKVRVNRVRTLKPSQSVRPGDVLTIALRGKVQVLKVLAGGQRRGPPAEARLLYDVVPAPEPKSASQGSAVVAERTPGSGRPSKRDRRLIERFMEDE
jgi:ribosome-associated heat shock protein Hsp15